MRHSQKPDKRHLICSYCHMGNCENCCDVSLIALGRKGLCECTRKNHSGEPKDQQILDPETGTVYAPSLEVTSDGKVERT